jgi:hypothetical protein
MAIFDVGTGQGSILRLTVNQDSQDVAGNYSIDSWSLVLYQGNATSSWTATPKAWSVTIGGQTWNGSFTFDFRSTDSVVIATGSTRVNHNGDGTASVALAWAIANTGTAVTGGNGSASFGQTTIPRASSVSYAASVDAGSVLTINVNRSSAAFSHKIYYSFGNASGTVALDVIDSYAWTVPMSLLNEIPSSVSGWGNLTTETWSGGTWIGSVVTQFTVTAGPGVVPDFTALNAGEANTSVANAVGALVQNASTLNVSLGGATSAYGSPLVSSRIDVAGQTINGSSGTTTTITASGTVYVYGTITDARGRSTTKSIALNFLPYAPPVIDTTAFIIQRALAAGTPSEQGNYIRVNLKASVSSLVVGGVQKNLLVYKIYTRPRGGSGWTLKTTVNPGGTAFNSYGLIGTYEVTAAAEVRVEVLDIFAISAIAGTLAVASVFMHWAGANGIGVGKYWEKGSIDSLGDIYIAGNRVGGYSLGDPAIESHGPTTPATSFPMGTSSVFVFPNAAWPVSGTYGTLVTTRTYPVGGGTIQYWSSYQSNNDQVYYRQWFYNASGWTKWQTMSPPMAAGSGSNAVGAYTTITFPAGRFSAPPMIVGSTTGTVVRSVHFDSVTATSALAAGFNHAGSVDIASSWMWHAIQVTRLAETGQ